MIDLTRNVGLVAGLIREAIASLAWLGLVLVALGFLFFGFVDCQRVAL